MPLRSLYQWSDGGPCKWPETDEFHCFFSSPLFRGVIYVIYMLYVISIPSWEPITCPFPKYFLSRWIFRLSISVGICFLLPFPGLPTGDKPPVASPRFFAFQSWGLCVLPCGSWIPWSNELQRVPWDCMSTLVESINLENLVYHFFRQLWLVLGVKLMEIHSNLFSMKNWMGLSSQWTPNVQ